MRAHRHVWSGGEAAGQVVLSRMCRICGAYQETGSRRVLVVLLALLLLAAAPVAAADWTAQEPPKPPTATETLATLDRELLPVHGRLVATIEDIPTAPTEAVTDAYVVIIRETALQGYGIVDATVSYPCFANYLAIERTMFLLWGDSADSYVAGDFPASNSQFTAGLYLLTTYSDLERSIVECDAEPEPTVAPATPAPTPRKTPTPLETGDPEPSP